MRSVFSQARKLSRIERWGLPGLFLILAALAFAWTHRFDATLSDFLFQMRGERPLCEEILFVHISDEDIAAVGSWPITRDFFGYMTHVLHELGAKTIAFDFLFSAPDDTYPEYDRVLADFFESSQNVCLPMVFREFEPRTVEKRGFALFDGREPKLPIEQFRKQAAAIGFSNLGDAATIRSVPIVAADGEHVALSFGAEMARLFLGYQAYQLIENRLVFESENQGSLEIPLQKYGSLRLNHFGASESAVRLGFFQLLKLFESDPDSARQHVAGKLVLVATTSAALPVLKATPFSEVFPAALLHATLAENIIHSAYLRDLPVFLLIVLILLMLLIPALVLRKQTVRIRLAILGAVLFGYWLVAFLLFSQLNVVLPLLFPSLALFASAVLSGLGMSASQRNRIKAEKSQLRSEIKSKIAALSATEKRLVEIERELQQARQQYAAASAQSKQLADERRQALEQLERQLLDMQAHNASDAAARVPESYGLVLDEKSPMQDVLSLIAKVAGDDIPVLILGETGTGKEMVARAIHAISPRKHHKFVAVNCGALPENLLESELFGHEKGSFTGAQSRRRGRFELADGGTIFLDEISETAPAFQVKLLRVLQEGTFERLGGERTIRADVRLICASNTDLKRAVDQGDFRADLYYRLNGFPIVLPPLRERRGDIALLAEHFLRKYGYDAQTSISEQAMAQLQSYGWPGNVRELENAVRRAAILAQSEERNLIREIDLPGEMQKPQAPSVAELHFQPLEQQILESLRRLKFSRSAISQTAKALGNRDRGTITEYFRGLCFDELVKADFDVEATAHRIAGTQERETIARVKRKIAEYLANLRQSIVTTNGNAETAPRASPPFKGLPRQYHRSLKAVIENLDAMAE